MDKSASNGSNTCTCSVAKYPPSIYQRCFYANLYDTTILFCNCEGFCFEEPEYGSPACGGPWHKTVCANCFTEQLSDGLIYVNKDTEWSLIGYPIEAGKIDNAIEYFIEYRDDYDHEFEYRLLTIGNPKQDYVDIMEKIMTPGWVAQEVDYG